MRARQEMPGKGWGNSTLINGKQRERKFVPFLRELDQLGKLVPRFGNAQRRAHARTLLSAQQTARPEFNAVIKPTVIQSSGHPKNELRHKSRNIIVHLMSERIFGCPVERSLPKTDD